jgi:hypothetical protein
MTKQTSLKPPGRKPSLSQNSATAAVNLALTEEVSRRLGLPEPKVIRAVVRGEITIRALDKDLPAKFTALLLKIEENCDV